MEKLLDKLFSDYVNMPIKSEDIKEPELDLEINKRRLKQSLSKNQKKLLLRFEDGKDSINDLNKFESFTIGFKLGLSIGYEANRDE